MPRANDTKYDKRSGPAVFFSDKERRHATDMELGCRALLKSILRTGKTHSQLQPGQIEALRKEHRL